MSTFSTRSWHEMVAKADPDLRKKPYSYVLSGRVKKFAQESLYTEPAALEFEGDQSGAIEFEGDQSGEIKFEGDQG